MEVKLTDYELKILRFIAAHRGSPLAGNKRIAIMAAADRLHKKGMVVDMARSKFAISKAGEAFLSQFDQPKEVPESSSENG